MVRQSDQAQDEVILGIPRKRMIIWLTIAPMILLLSFISWNVSRDRYVVTAKVVEMDAPRDCWEASRNWLLGKSEAHRSHRPRRDYLGYCGVVRTSVGNFALPHTYPRPWLGQKRADIYDRMKPGCQYDLVVISPKGRPTSRNRGIASNNPPYIRRVMFTYPC